MQPGDGKKIFPAQIGDLGDIPPFTRNKFTTEGENQVNFKL